MMKTSTNSKKRKITQTQTSPLNRRSVLVAIIGGADRAASIGCVTVKGD
jgi:hypothetical protein